MKTNSTVSRISEMEERYDRLIAALSSYDAAKAALEAAEASFEAAKDWLKGLQSDYETLRDYLDSGKWLKDFKADEGGKIPSGLKRGVLSEDGLYNLLEDVEAAVIQVGEMPEKTA